jgi:serine phosphatase RsbU (regulator of sigma subunit)
MVFDKEKNFEFMKSQIPPIGILKYSTESMVKSIATNLKEKTFLIYTDGVTEGYLSNGQELGVEGVERIIKKIENVTPQNIINSITTELNWGAEKLRDDITCLALNIRNTELAKQK